MTTQMETVVTSDLSQFGLRERRIMGKLLAAWESQGLPDDFEEDEVSVAFNMHSGYVFLTNSEYQVAMLNDDDKLESWYACPQCGYEGFKKDMAHNGNAACKSYLREIGITRITRRSAGKSE